MLQAVAWQGSDHLSSTDRSVQLTQWSEYRASRPPKVPVVPRREVITLGRQRGIK